MPRSGPQNDVDRILAENETKVARERLMLSRGQL